MNHLSRTDIALELIKTTPILSDEMLSVSEIVLDEHLAARYGKNRGRYVTIETCVIADYKPDCFSRLAKETARALKSFKRDLSRTLVVGLGNAAMTADALGSEVCKNIQTLSGRRKTLCPSVVGTTGIESFDIIKGTVDRIKPTTIIAVDSLAAAATTRVARVIQLSDAGITPGSGVSNHKQRLDERSLGVPVLSIGIPLVVYASTIIRDAGGDESGFEGLIVTPKDIDVLVMDASEVIAAAINEV